MPNQNSSFYNNKGKDYGHAVVTTPTTPSPTNSSFYPSSNDYSIVPLNGLAWYLPLP